MTNTAEKKRRVVFLDRDGVINRDSPLYIKRWEEFEFLPRSIEAIRRLNENGFEIIVITNQSAIGRRFITAETLEGMHRRMLEQIRRQGGDVLDIFYCPHRPEDNCDCRKPRPGLIQQACRRHTVRAAESIMAGDSAKDIECARNAGCAAAVLVKTGNGISAKTELDRKNVPIDYVAEDLYGAAEWIINKSFKF